MNTLGTQRAAFLVQNLDLPSASEVASAQWEHFQLMHLQDDGMFRIEVKARQIAWSFLVAMEAVAEAVLVGQSSAFVSINLEEAKEKIRYARAVYRNLDLARLPGITRDNELGLELANGARLISLPARPPRGRARMNIYLDEFAHVQWDRKIYQATLPIVSKGGRLRIGSSPLGSTGVFWEVFGEELRQYPGYRRKRTPWWEVLAFCRNVALARQLAPTMDTAERVEMFGNDRIKALFANMILEDFQQEYECDFVDESTSWIPWEEIKAIQDAELVCVMATAKGKKVGPALDAIGQLEHLLGSGTVERSFGGGMDVGRTRNTTEIYLAGVGTEKRHPLRLAISLDAMEFDDQLQVLTAIMERLPVSMMQIDRNGIGRNIAENLEKKFGVRCQGVDFTSETKLNWATNTKVLVQQRRAVIPVDRDLAYQIHSIKRLITPSRNIVFDVETSEKHHADRFWAWALALASASGPKRTVRIGWA